MIGRGQHPLHHVLVGAVCRHRQHGRANECGKERVGFLQHRLERRTERQIGVPPGLKHLHIPKPAQVLLHSLEAAWNIVKQQKNGENH